MIKARYKSMSADLIKSYNNVQASVEELESIFKKELNKADKVEVLSGGKVSNVYRVNYDGFEKVVKISKGMYRVNELIREAEVLKYIMNQGYNNIVPRIDRVKTLDKIAYIVEEYFDGSTVRDILNVTEDVEERFKIWEEVGKTLSSIHMLCQEKDDNSEWLKGQFQIARTNMENNLLDCEEFQEQKPKDMLEFLILNKPNQNLVCLLHGDFRSKNIMLDRESNIKVIDWGFVDVGDPYYDLSIIDYYFKDNLERESFYKGYKCNQYDENLIKYYDKLSKFINV